MSRRSFLGNLGALAGASVVGSLVGTTYVQTAFAATSAPPGTQNVLVVLSLRGGADGLSIVVPHGDPAYAAARPFIAVPTKSLLVPDEMFGLHPKMKPLQGMWESGRLGAVHAVGLPQPNRSHFDATLEVEEAAPGSRERNGWLNRLIGLDGAQISTEAAQMGSSIIPTSLWGEEPTIAIRKMHLMTLAGPPKAEPMARRKKSLELMWRDIPGPLGRGSRAAMDVAARLGGDDERPADDPAEDDGAGTRYPSGELGDALRESASLIRADVGASVVTVDHGNWDMHAGLGDLDAGQMHRMVDELASALAAFFADLGPDADRVTVVTVSEFGRRIEENGSRGLDHGYGNMMLVAGAGVRGGKHYGSWPGLGLEHRIDGDLAVTRDYRSVLTEVIRARFGADASKVFPGFRPEKIGIMEPV